MAMRSSLWFALSVAILAAVGCQSKETKTDSTKAAEEPRTQPPPARSPAVTQGKDRAAPPRRILGLEEGWELAPAATYTASQTPSEVIIKATGEHPTAGYETRLVMSPLRIYPPQWMLAQKKPTGAAAQVVTPFEVTASFKAREPVEAVHVSDATGKHVVPVDQARD
jgi:hypothetical protein